MAERNERALAAARDVFLRYGVRRATMGDIATEAGISRQTLYTLFGGKDAVLRAVIADHTTTSIAAIRSDAAAAPDLAAALDALFMHFTQTPFTLLHASPNAEDILQGRDRIAREAHEAARPAYEAAIADVLAPHASALAAHGLTPQRLAVAVYAAAKGFKALAADQAALATMIDGLKRMILALVGPAGRR